MRGSNMPIGTGPGIEERVWCGCMRRKCIKVWHESIQHNPGHWTPDHDEIEHAMGPRPGTLWLYFEHEIMKHPKCRCDAIKRPHCSMSTHKESCL